MEVFQDIEKEEFTIILKLLSEHSTPQDHEEPINFEHRFKTDFIILHFCVIFLVLYSNVTKNWISAKCETA